MVNIIGNGQLVPPIKKHVLIYFQQKGRSEKEALLFFEHFSKRKWLNRRNTRLSNWKVAAWEWTWLIR